MKDYQIKAGKVKSLIRQWRAKGVSAGDTMKLMMLYLGVDRFLSAETMAYPQSQFNKMRKDMGFKTVSAMLEVVRMSGAFQIVRHRADHHVVAIVSPGFGNTQWVGGDLYLEAEGMKVLNECVAKCDESVANCDSVYLNIVSEDTYFEQGHDAMPLPKLDEKLFHPVAKPEAKIVVDKYFMGLLDDIPRINDIFENLLPELYKRCRKNRFFMGEVLEYYLRDRVQPVFERRKGIEKWKQYQIDAWLKSRHQQKLAHVKCDEAIRNCKINHAEQWAYYKGTDDI